MSAGAKAATAIELRGRGTLSALERSDPTWGAGAGAGQEPGLWALCRGKVAGCMHCLAPLSWKKKGVGETSCTLLAYHIKGLVDGGADGFFFFFN